MSCSFKIIGAFLHSVRYYDLILNQINILFIFYKFYRYKLSQVGTSDSTTTFPYH